MGSKMRSDRTSIPLGHATYRSDDPFAFGRVGVGRTGLYLAKNYHTGPPINLRYPPTGASAPPDTAEEATLDRGCGRVVQGRMELRQRLESTPIASGVDFRECARTALSTESCGPRPKSSRPPLGATRCKQTARGQLNVNSAASLQGGRVKRPSWDRTVKQWHDLASEHCVF